MKITPIEIRQHTFEKKGFGGYRPEEVDAFLASLSQEWERVSNDSKMLKMQLEIAEKELNKFKEIELTLFRTLKTADDTSTQITDQAQKAAEKYLEDAKQKADELLADARKRSTLMVQDAENQSRYIKENILNDLKAMEHDFKAMEKYKDGLINQLRTLALNATESVERFEKKFNEQSLKAKIEEVTAQATESVEALPVAALPESTGDTPGTEIPDLLDQEETAYLDTNADDVTALAETTVDDHADAQAYEVAEAGFPITVPETEAESHAEPQTVHEGAEKPKSGSFFDQI